MARRGQTVQINGSNFDQACSNNTVVIGAARLQPAGHCSSSSITFAVPYGASSGATTVQVIAPKGASNSFGYSLATTQLVVATNGTEARTVAEAIVHDAFHNVTFFGGAIADLPELLEDAQR